MIIKYINNIVTSSTSFILQDFKPRILHSHELSIEVERVGSLDALLFPIEFNCNEKTPAHGAVKVSASGVVMATGAIDITSHGAKPSGYVT